MLYLLADFMIRFNAATKRRKVHFFMPYSATNMRVVEMLLRYNCISAFFVDVSKLTGNLQIKITPVYFQNTPLIQKIELVSRPGRRVYWSSSELSLNFARNNFQGFYILSTPSGICSSNELITANVLNSPVSGEVLLKINL